MSNRKTLETVLVVVQPTIDINCQGKESQFHHLSLPGCSSSIVLDSYYPVLLIRDSFKDDVYLRNKCYQFGCFLIKISICVGGG